MIIFPKIMIILELDRLGVSGTLTGTRRYRAPGPGSLLGT